MKCLRCRNFLGFSDMFCYRLMHEYIEDCRHYEEVDAGEYFNRCITYALILLKRAEQYALAVEPSRRDIQYLMHVVETAKSMIREISTRLARQEAKRIMM